MVRGTALARRTRRTPEIAVDTAVEVRGVSKSFRLPQENRTTLKEHVLHPFRRVGYVENHALADIDLEVARGEFFGVVGPNGSGKSTLLKVMAGIYRADSGIVRLNGVVSPFIELGVGFNMELNGRANIRINGTLLGLTQSQIDERFDEIVHFAELERFVDQKLKNFSSGMLVRLAYSIAIQVPFDILLLDEVLAVGDRYFQEKCFETFEQFGREGKTVVFVTHDLRSVSRFCRRAVLLERGRTTALGSGEEVVALYRERKTSGLLG
jgi:ABC-type polysaccharide/polyol phosphate transport system ATPase subunit